nr:hypothetical protein [uncultured Peptostreptococcus sp.]
MEDRPRGPKIQGDNMKVSESNKTKDNNRNNMARKISLMGILLAFNAIIYILVNYIPTNTIALLVLAGLPAMIVVVEFGLRDACLYVLAGLILAFVLINNKLHFVTYLLTFSSYPLVKALVENVKSFKIQLGLKLLYANLALLVLYLVYKQFVVIDRLVMDYIPLALLVYNLAFLVYDRAMSQFIIYYIDKLSKIIRKR